MVSTAARTFPKKPGENPQQAQGENALTPWDSNPRPPRSTLLSLEGNLRGGYQERRCRVIACIHSWTKRYDGTETKTCVIRVQFMTHSAIQQKGVRVYISFTCTHPYICHGLRPASAGGRGSGAARTDEMYRGRRVNTFYMHVFSPATHISRPRKAKRRLEERRVGRAVGGATSSERCKPTNSLERENVAAKRRR